MATKTNLLARYRPADQIRQYGGIGNLNEGPVIQNHGISTRLIAWPGNGFQTESVHVLTLKPGEASEFYTFASAEEGMLCAAGQGEVFLSDTWVSVAPGDIAYFPEGVRHAVRHPGKSEEELVMVTQITPPQLDQYVAAGFYHVGLGTMNYDACLRASINAPTGELKAPLALAWRDTNPEFRSWNRSAELVRREGALFNMFMGADFAALGIPARLVLWPGAGTRTAGFNFAYCPDVDPDLIHTHPVSDECLMLWAGKGKAYLGGHEWIDLDPLDCILAPSGVFHGHAGRDDFTFWGGFASPPQLDLLMKTPYYTPDAILSGQPVRLEYPMAETEGRFRAMT